jgi:hypothetical protein
MAFEQSLAFGSEAHAVAGHPQGCAAAGEEAAQPSAIVVIGGAERPELCGVDAVATVFVDGEQELVVALGAWPANGRRLGPLELSQVGIDPGQSRLDASEFGAHHRDIRWAGQLGW